jgi:hypothetical protein
VLLALPALLYYPLRFLQDNSYPSLLWYFAERSVWISLLTPLCFVFMLVKLRRFKARAPSDRVVAIALTIVTGWVAILATHFYALFVPIPFLSF